MKNPTNIYVMKCREFYKIGVSCRVEKRRYSISSGLPFDVELIANYKPNIKFYDRYDLRRAVGKIERFLHHTFASKRVKGEWFLLSDEELSSIPDLIKQALLTKPNCIKEIPIEVRAK